MSDLRPPRVRRAAVAGAFYPADPARLGEDVDGFLRRARPMGPVPKALIVPHAGYVYSGATAGEGYACLAPGAERIRHVILIGPTHRLAIRGVALPDADAMDTPLGEVPLWSKGVEIALSQPGVILSAAAHAEEHSLEVHLPFLQRALPKADVVPLAAGWIGPGELARLVDALWGGEETAIVVSSDLSHYLPYRKAQAVDEATIEQILALGGPIDHEQACGATPVNGLLALGEARRLGGRLLAACNSGDTAGDRRRVVGYAAIAFDEGVDDDVS